MPSFPPLLAMPETPNVFTPSSETQQTSVFHLTEQLTMESMLQSDVAKHDDGQTGLISPTVPLSPLTALSCLSPISPPSTEQPSPPCIEDDFLTGVLGVQCSNEAPTVVWKDGAKIETVLPFISSSSSDESNNNLLHEVCLTISLLVSLIYNEMHQDAEATEFMATFPEATEEACDFLTILEPHHYNYNPKQMRQLVSNSAARGKSVLLRNCAVKGMEFSPMSLEEDLDLPCETVVDVQGLHDQVDLQSSH